MREQEQAELARELHDELGQSLEAIGVCAAYLLRHGLSEPEHPQRQCVRDIQQETQRIHRHIRALLSELRPHGLDGLSLAEALEELTRQWQARRPEVQLDAHWQAMPPLPARHALQLYRAVQECLTNIARHSQASAVQLRAEVTDGRLCVSVSDNGVARVVPKYGCGLLGMRERLESVGGGVTLALNPGGGLCVSLHAPLVGLS
ncbi:MAG: sensor histidine kinase [Rivihabitans pingtungensis]